MHSNLIRYLKEPVLIFRSLPKLKKEWQQEFDLILQQNRKHKLKVAAYLSVIFSLAATFGMTIIRGRLSGTLVDDSKLVPKPVFLAVVLIHFFLFISATIYIFNDFTTRSVKLKKIGDSIYKISIFTYATGMFLILWSYLGINNSYITSLFIYVILLHYPNRLNFIGFSLYCLAYFAVITLIPQPLPYKFNGLFSGVISSLTAWFVGEFIIHEQINEFLSRKYLEERTAELTHAYKDIYRLNELLNSENQRMGLELNVAQQLQEIILPKPEELNSIDRLDIAATMSPATEVGGDYYDFLINEDQTKATIAIADVTGHGLESGIFTIMIQTAVRMIHNLEDYSGKESLQVLNKVLYDNARRMGSDKSLTLVLIKYDRGHIRILGQHEEVIIVRNNGDLFTIDTVDLGFPLGLEPDISSYLDYRDFVLNSGDSLILYTDGITEASNNLNQFYGTDRFYEVIRRNYFRSATEIKENIIYDLMEFIHTARIYDDITLLVIKQK